MKSITALFSLALLISALLGPLLRRLFIRLAKLDLPDARKLHETPVPRSGGVAIVCAYLVSIGLLTLLPAGGNVVLEKYSAFLLRLLPATAIVLLTGLLDDWLGLRPRHKIAGQFLAATFAYLAGIRLFDFGAGWEWAAFLSTAGWLVLCSNAFNLIDGADGLAGSLGVIASLGLILAAWSANYYPLALLFAPLLGAILPFLRSNWPPANQFLGDAGSLTIGFLLGCGGATLARHFPNGGGLTAAILFLALPLMEVAVSIVRRQLRGVSIFTADCHHFHHQLRRQGLSPSQMLWRLGTIALMGTSIGIAQMEVDLWTRTLLVLPFVLMLLNQVASFSSSWLPARLNAQGLGRLQPAPAVAENREPTTVVLDRSG